MVERILIPLDGSNIGEAALLYINELVSKLSPKTKVQITLLQVVSPLTHYAFDEEAVAPTPYTAQEIEQNEKQAMDYLKKAGEGLRSQGATVKTRVVIGNAAEEIISVADEINADLIAMSTHGRSGISRWVLRSVTDRILRGGHKPILLVRAPKKGKLDEEEGNER